jgi:hypothetical protein
VEQELIAANARIGEAKAAFYPSLLPCEMNFLKVNIL